MEQLIAFLDGLTIWHWLAVAGVLLALELMTGTMYLLWPAAAAAVVAVMKFFMPIMTWELELLSFAAAAVGLTILGSRWPRRRRRKGDRADLNDRAAQLVGRRGRVTGAFENGRGRVDVYGSEWRAELEADAIPPGVGSSVEVVSVNGLTLTVRRTA